MFTVQQASKPTSQSSPSSAWDSSSPTGTEFVADGGELAGMIRHYDVPEDRAVAKER